MNVTTNATKRSDISKLFFTIVAVIAVSLLISKLIGTAYAGTEPAPPPVPGLLGLIMTGKYMAAIGVFLIALVTLVKTSIGGKIPWLRTRPGGYVLGFGSSVLLYIGTAIATGQSLTLGVFAAAFAAGWTSAGGWEHLQDLISWLTPPTRIVLTRSGDTPVTSPGRPVISRIALSLGLAGMCLLIGCGLLDASGCGAAQRTGSIVIDCTLADASETAALLDEIKPLLSGNPVNWATIEQKALAAGTTIGGCVLAQLVQQVLSGTKAVAVPVENSWQARQALEDLRSRLAPSAVYHTRYGDL